MERRVFIAVLLSFVVLYTYQTYFAPPPPKLPAASPSSAPAGAGATATAGSKPAAAPAPTVPLAESVVGDAAERPIVVDTPTARVTFTNKGARVLHWQLKQYRDTNGELVDLVPSNLPATEMVPF